MRKKGISRVFIEAGVNFNNFLIENNYINDFYHFYSNEIYKNNGFNNSKHFFKKINKLKLTQSKIKVNLFKDKLVKYSIV